MMTILIYRDGILIDKMRAERLDVTKNSLTIDGATCNSRPRVADYFYFGAISFQMLHDVLRVDIFEPDPVSEIEHHIRLTVYDW